MSHTKSACLNAQDLGRLLGTQATPKLTPNHLTRAADSTPYLENIHDFTLFLLPVFICRRRWVAHGPLHLQLRLISLSGSSHINLCYLEASRRGRDADLSASHSATAEVGNAYLLPWLLMMIFNWSWLEPVWETSQILAVALSRPHHDH